MIWAEKNESLDLLLVVTLEALMHPFLHSTALLLLDRASEDGAETISAVTKWTVSI